MLQRFHKFHPGLVGAAIGLSAGVLYSVWWLGLKSADVGLTEAETKWLLVATVAVIVGFPILIGYFAYFAYTGLQMDSSKSAADGRLEYDCRNCLFPDIWILTVNCCRIQRSDLHLNGDNVGTDRRLRCN